MDNMLEKQVPRPVAPVVVIAPEAKPQPLRNLNVMDESLMFQERSGVVLLGQVDSSLLMEPTTRTSQTTAKVDIEPQLLNTEIQNLVITKEGEWTHDAVFDKLCGSVTKSFRFTMDVDGKAVVFERHEGQIRGMWAHQISDWGIFKNNYSRLVLNDEHFNIAISVEKMNLAVRQLLQAGPKTDVNTVLNDISKYVMFMDKTVDIAIFNVLFDIAIARAVLIMTRQKAASQTVNASLYKQLQNRKRSFSYLGDGCRGYLKRVCARLLGRQVVASDALTVIRGHGRDVTANNLAN
jgi:hypothetical protein